MWSGFRTFPQNQIGDGGQYEVILASYRNQAIKAWKSRPLILIPTLGLSLIRIYKLTHKKTLWSACVKGNIKALSLNLILEY